MKKTIAIIIGCAAIAFSTSSFSWCQYGACQDQAGGYGDNNCNSCQCADLGYGKNPCMNPEEYCDVYGNIGSR